MGFDYLDLVIVGVTTVTKCAKNDELRKDVVNRIPIKPALLTTGDWNSVEPTRNT